MKPFFDIQAQYLAHKNEIDKAIQTVLHSGQFILGPQVRELEEQLEAYSGAKHCISCANGTDALQIALMAIGIQPGDEIITTPFTFIATAETAVLLGARPVFVDIDEKSYLIDVEKIEQKINSNTRAIIPVSLYGQIPDMDAINALAKKYSAILGRKIYVIEDAAQSFGATYKGKKSCNVSEIATTSFFPTKPLGCYGDGGAVFTNNDELAEIFRQIRVHGSKERYQHVRLGINSRLDTIQAAILQVKLKYLDTEIMTRNRIARTYDRLYNNTEVITPMTLPDRTHVYGQYTVSVPNRTEFMATLAEQGIPTVVHYPVPLNKQPIFLNDIVTCPISDRVSNHVVSLPMCLYT